MGTLVPMYTPHLYSKMGVWGRFSVHISPKIGDIGPIVGDMYKKTLLGDRFLVHTGSVQL